LMTFPKTFVRRLKSCWTKLNDWALCLILGKGVNEMAIVYATLIIKGKKTFAQVPDSLKEQVREILNDLDCPELAE